MKNDFVTGHLNRMFSQREEESPSSQGPSWTPLLPGLLPFTLSLESTCECRLGKPFAGVSLVPNSRFPLVLSMGALVIASAICVTEFWCYVLIKWMSCPRINEHPFS
jgi:hypothetical protein